MVKTNRKTDKPLGVIDSKRKKINPLWITCIVSGTFVLIASLIVLWVAANKRSEIESVTSASSQSAKELEAREAFLTTRKAYLEKMSRTDYSTSLRTTITQPGDSIQVGWRQLAAVDWAQSIKSDLKDARNTRNNPLYRFNETPALEVLKLQTMGMLSEIAAGNTDFYIGYTRTDGTKVEEKLSAGGAAYLALGKLEAIDLANTLTSIPEVNYPRIVTDISGVNESYVLALRGLLQAQGYTDSLDRLRDASKTADEIELLKQLNQQKLRELRKDAPEPRPVLKGKSNKGGS